MVTLNAMDVYMCLYNPCSCIKPQQLDHLPVFPLWQVKSRLPSRCVPSLLHLQSPWHSHGDLFALFNMARSAVISIFLTKKKILLDIYRYISHLNYVKSEICCCRPISFNSTSTDMFITLFYVAVMMQSSCGMQPEGCLWCYNLHQLA